MLSTALYFNIFISVFLFVCLYLGSPYIENILVSIRKVNLVPPKYNYETYLKIISFGIPFGFLNVNFLAVLRMLREPKKYALVSVFQFISNFCLILLFIVVLNYGIIGFMWAYSLSNIMACLLSFSFVYKYHTLNFSPQMMRRFLSYSLPQFPSVFLSWGLSQIGLFFINYFCILSQLGYYNIALRIASLLTMLLMTYRLAYSPYAMSIMKDKNSRDIYSGIYSLCMIGFGVTGALIGIFAKPILVILTPPAYHAAYSIVGIIVFGYVFQGSNDILAIGIGISKRTKFISYAQLVAFCTGFLAYLFFVPRFFAWGAAIALSISYVVQNFAYYYFAQRVYPIPYKFKKNLSFVIIVFSLVFINTMLVKNEGFLISMLIATGSSFVVLVLTWFIGMNLEQRNLTKIYILTCFNNYFSLRCHNK